MIKPNSPKEDILDSSILEDQVEYVDEDSLNDPSKSEKQRKKEIRQMEEDFSGDEEDYEEVGFMTHYQWVDETQWTDTKASGSRSRLW